MIHPRMGIFCAKTAKVGQKPLKQKTLLVSVYGSTGTTRIQKKNVNGPEEYKKAIGLQHHSQDRPSNDYKEEANPKRYGSLSDKNI